MNKLNRNLDIQKMEQSKSKVMDNVMAEIQTNPKRKLSFSFNRRYILASLVMFVGLMSLIFIDTPSGPTQVVLGNYESEKIAEVTYLSGSIISNSFTIFENTLMVNKSFDFIQMALENETEFEGNIDEFNSYFDTLRVFMDDGLDNQVTVTALIDSEFESKIEFVADGQTFVFLVSIDEEFLVGVLTIDSVTLDVTGSYKQNDDQIEMKLKASNGTDYIEIEYKVESEDDIEQVYHIEQFIGGIESSKEVKVKTDGDEVSVEIQENDDHYELEKEIENGIVVYKLKYEINGNEGEAEITEQIDEFGNVTYAYSIDEEGFHKDIELDDPDDHEDEEDSENESEEDQEDTENPEDEEDTPDE